MQTGMKAGLAIVLAVFLTGIVGFLTAVVPEDEERTYYDQVSDLTPIVDASAIDSYTEYNPVTNVSGWANIDGVTIPTLTTGISAYPYRYTTAGEDSDISRSVKFAATLDEYPPDPEMSLFWPVATVYSLYESSIPNSIEYNDITLKTTGRGQIGVTKDFREGESFTICVLHIDTSVAEPIHMFTYEVHVGESGGYFQQEITTLSALDNQQSRTIRIGGSEGFFDLQINVSLGAHQTIRVDMLSHEGYRGQNISLYNGEIVNGLSSNPVSPKEYYGGGLDQQYAQGAPSTRTTSISNYLVVDGRHLTTEYGAYTVYPLSMYFPQSASIQDGTFISIAGLKYAMPTTFYHGTRTWDGDSGDNVSGTCRTNISSIGYDHLVYVKDDEKWYPGVLSENGLYYEADMTKPGYGIDEIFMFAYGFKQAATINATEIEVQYEYIDGTKFVTVADGVTAKWSNYMDSTVGGKTVTVPYNNGAIVLLTEPGTTISSDKAFYKDTDGNVTQGSFALTVPTSIPYSMARVTLDFQNGTYYAQGIVWGSIDEDERGTGNWTLRPYQYPISIGLNGIPDVSYVQGISVEKAGGTKVFVVETSVQTDPMGRLWGDPAIYLGYYFPDYFTYDSATGNTGVPTTAIRMLINGIVSYGTSLTINGQYMPVADGNITFTYYTYETETIPSTDPNIPPITNTITVTNEGNMPVKGMAIDWEEGHVYLVFTEQGKTRYDLGEYNTTAANVVIAGTDTGKDTVATDIISGTGTWYWQSNLYTINHAIETTLHLDLTQGLSGWGMSLQVSMLLFAGMLIVGVAIVHYYYRDSDEPMGILDWVIIGLAILLCLGVAAI